MLRFFRHWRSSYTGIPATIWYLSLVSLVNRVGGMVIAFMTLYLTQELHFSISQAGYVMGCFGVGALVGAFTGGRLTDKLGYYPVQLWSLVLNGLMLLVVMQVRDFWAMCAAVFVMSVISEVFRPANSVAIGLYSTPENRTRSISLYRMSVNLGWAVAPAMGGALAMAGWQYLFWVDGLTCVFAAVLLYYLVPNKPDHGHAQKGADDAPAPAAASAYHDRPYLAFAVLTMLGALIFMQLLWTVPVFFKETYHWSEGRIGLVSALNGLIVFLVEMPLIYRIEGRRPRLSYVRFGLALYALSYAALLLPGALVPALLFITAISFGEIFAMPFSSNFAYARAAGAGKPGQYMALYTMAYSVANILAPLLGTQIIAAFGYAALWGVLITLGVVTWLGFLWLQLRLGDERRPTAERADVVVQSPLETTG